MIEAKCDCGATYKVKDEKAGAKLKCKKCSGVFTVQKAAGEPVAAAASATENSGPDLDRKEEWTEHDLAMITRLKEANDKILNEISKAVVGQETVVKQLMIAIFAKGHCLLMGVPGLGKTLLVQTLASSLSMNFKRVQFTPDLMPSDITGTEVIQEDKNSGERVFRFIKGPIFTNILLADEINRTPPKTQASLLEAMQEKQVTVGGERYPLAPPFFVLATQNPIEQEGTYPLPEAQLDRFMFLINVGYPTEEEEVKILKMTTAGYKPDLQPVLTGDEIIELQELVRKVIVSDEILVSIVQMVRKTRITEASATESVKRFVSWGAGPRACQNLVLGAKANAILEGRNEVTMADVFEIAKPVLGHRILVNFVAQSEGVTTHNIVDDLIKDAG